MMQASNAIETEPKNDRIVTLQVDLDDLHQAIRDSVRQALLATGHKIIDANGFEDTERKIRELGRNAAAALMVFAVIED